MKKFLRNIASTWYMYLIAILLCSISMVLLTNFINKPRNEETISIFTATTSLNTSKMEEQLNKNKPSYLREVVSHASVYYSSDFDYLYSGLGKEVSDLIILPESKIYSEVVTYYYSTLDEQCVRQYINSPSFYTPEGLSLPYGFKVRSKGDSSNTILDFSNSSYDEDYYAFIYKKSLHGGKNNNSNWDTAMQFAKIIVEYK